jgi:hypothetical protein
MKFRQVATATVASTLLITSPISLASIASANRVAREKFSFLAPSKAFSLTR